MTGRELSVTLVLSGLFVPVAAIVVNSQLLFPASLAYLAVQNTSLSRLLPECSRF